MPRRSLRDPPGLLASGFWRPNRGANGRALPPQPAPVGKRCPEPARTLRHSLAELLERRLARGGRHLSAAEIAAPALVFAPHPDDECLGCGGTILRKSIAQAEVGIVFVSDGAASHAGLIDPQDLRRRRIREGRAAAARLGVHPKRVTFLAHADGDLSRARLSVAAEIAALVERHRPAQVFVPHAGEPPADHRAVRASVLHALSRCSQPVQVLEYPVWWWFHWPWVRLVCRPRGLALDVWRQTLRTWFGCRPARPFNRWVDLDGLLDRKRTALAQHISQMSRPPGQPHWPILADIAAGDFLNCFFREREFMMAYHVRGGRRINE